MRDATKYFVAEIGENEKKCLERISNFKKRNHFQMEFLRLLIGLLKDDDLKDIRKAF